MAYRGNLIGGFLEAVAEATGFFSWPIEGSSAWVRKQVAQERKGSYNTLRNLRNRGLVRATKRQNKTFFEITKKGELYLLAKKAKINTPRKVWDRHWRLVVFDIPEAYRNKRNELRYYLKKLGFAKLQASVFISPWPVGRPAIEFLKQSGLIEFIRIMKINEIDSDLDLRKRFKLFDNRI